MKVAFKCFRWFLHQSTPIIIWSIWSQVQSSNCETPRFGHGWGDFSGEMGRPRAGFYFLPKKEKMNDETW